MGADLIEAAALRRRASRSKNLFSSMLYVKAMAGFGPIRRMDAWGGLR
jgi:hypothetical protein